VHDPTLAESLDFTNQRILITGAAGGLGSSLAHAFACAGAELVLADIDQAGLNRVAATFTRPVATHVFDQADLGSIAELADAVGPVDVLINNAAVLLVQPLLDSDPVAISQVINTNLVGPMVLARHVAASMVARRCGVIINISSQLGFCGAAGRGAYATAKAGLAQFTKTASVEWAPHGVRVLAIAPGRLLTTMSTFLGRDEAAYKAGIARVPAGRYGTPEEIAQLVVVLASPLAAYIVGDTLIADGGYVLG
jgi:NAD(P)-dependent dehydrogenase (short-subunit alcohol dehydrogenase family)